MKCNICNSTSFTHSFAVKKNNYWICADCNSALYYPIPSEEEIDEFYRNYITYKIGLSEYMVESTYPAFVSNLSLTLNDLKWPFKAESNIRLLDAGCGNGFFLQYLNEKYPTIKTEGLDLSLECVNRCREKGLNVSMGDIFSSTEAGTYDFITLFHVIEHVKNPIEWINKIYSLLKSDGELIIETPVYGLVAESFKENWRYFMPVEHLNIFSKNAMLDTLKNNGFEIIKYITYGSGNIGADMKSINKRAMDNLVKKADLGDTLVVYAKKTNV